MSTLLEVCIDSLESAVAAKAGGADRLEVCSSLAAGGTTPSYGLVKQCVEYVGLPIMMMIRPHDGGFIYSDADLDTMLHDIQLGHSLGVAGFVFGALTEQRKVHAQQCRRLLQAAGSAETVFHRAFDITANPLDSLEVLTDLGFTRVLTSGQAASAVAGAPLIRQLVDRAADRITILPGSGVTPANAQQILHDTGAQEIHSSASVAATGQTGDQVSFGLARRITCPKVVRAIKQALATQCQRKS